MADAERSLAAAGDGKARRQGATVAHRSDYIKLGFEKSLALRSPYPIDQTDLALRRRFNLTERVKLDIRAEYFNVFNHPMFGAPGLNQPDTQLGISDFGKVDTTTNEVLGGGGTEGGQNAL